MSLSGMFETLLAIGELAGRDRTCASCVPYHDGGSGLHCSVCGSRGLFVRHGRKISVWFISDEARLDCSTHVTRKRYQLSDIDIDIAVNGG